jgi:hypothetical protein
MNVLARLFNQVAEPSPSERRFHHHRDASGPATQTLLKLLAIRMIKPLAGNDFAAGVSKGYIAEFVVDIHSGTRYI